MTGYATGDGSRWLAHRGAQMKVLPLNPAGGSCSERRSHSLNEVAGCSRGGADLEPQEINEAYE